MAAKERGWGPVRHRKSRSPKSSGFLCQVCATDDSTTTRDGPGCARSFGSSGAVSAKCLHAATWNPRGAHDTH